MKKFLLSLLLVFTSAIAAMANGHTVGISSQTNVACFGSATGSVTVTVSGGTGPFTYSWSPGGQTTASITGLTEGSYTVIVTDNSDLSTASATVTISEPATALTVASSSITICAGQCGTLTSTATGGVPGYTYTWSPLISTWNGLQDCPTSTTTYTVTVLDANGCTATSAATINVSGVPTTISGQTEVCMGSGTTLTATGGGTYSWTTGETTPSITVSPASTTTYTVTTSTGGCTGSAAIVVTIANLIPVISGTNTICNGQCTTLTSSGGGTYSWAPTGDITPYITVCPIASTTYTVVVTNGGCSGSATTQVVVNPNPIPTITGATTICNGSSTTLTVTGGTTYSWSPATGLSSNVGVSTVANPTTTTTYTVFAITAGCSGSASVAVTVQPLLTGVTITDSIYKETCLGTGDGAIDITLSGSNTGPFTYEWSTGANTEDITNLVTNNYLFTLWDVSKSNCISKRYELTADGTNCGFLSGNVFDDKNIDCTNNSGDAGLSNIMIVVNPGNRIAYTNMQGGYIFNSVPYGTYTLTQQISNPYIFPSCATTLNATLTASNKNIIALDFADTTASTKNIAIYGYTTGIVPGFSCFVAFYLNNLTGTPTSGTVCVALPAGYGSLVTSGPSGYSVNADTVCWAYSNIIGFSGYYCVYFTVPVNTPLGSQFKACAKATVVGTDVDLSNNNYCIARNVTGSFDPNDKSVNPIGEGPQGNITLNDKTLNYHINFQNTGNGPAVNIVVKDSLSDKLDINSLEVTGASHNYILDIMDGNVLRWKFNNIMLADSGSNEPASHGWIDYRVKQKSSNQIGNQIKNTAYIYFDFNPAVVTNTTVNTIAAQVGIEETTSTNYLVKVYPNPFSDNTTFVIQSIKLNEMYSFELFDVLGKQVRSIKEINTKEFQISRNGLENGIYFYKIYSNETLVDIGKLVVK